MCVCWDYGGDKYIKSACNIYVAGYEHKVFFKIILILMFIHLFLPISCYRCTTGAGHFCETYWFSHQTGIFYVSQLII